MCTSLSIYMYRICTRCSTTQDLKEFKSSKTICQICFNKYRREYKQSHKKQIHEQGIRYREKNKDAIKTKRQEYYENNKDDILRHIKEYREDNKETIKIRKHKYYENNKE